MKKSFLSFCRTSLRKTLFIPLFTGMLSIPQLMASPLTYADDQPGIIAPGAIRVISYIMANSLVFKLHLENPAREKISIRILNNTSEVVYKQELGTPGVYICKYNLQELPNGNYTFVVMSAGYTYSKPFSLRSIEKREVKIQDDAPLQQAIF
jgi:hypothetical protein